MTRMTGRELRAARQELGLSEAQFAEAVGKTAAQVFEWEQNDAVLPKPVASLLASQLHSKRALDLLAKSGLAECAEVALLDKRVVDGGFKEADAQALLDHLRACPTCTARHAYVETRMGPPPEVTTGVWFMDWFRPLWELEGWKGGAVAGMAFILMWVAVGIPITIGIAIVGREWEYLLWTATLLGVAVFGGGAGGLVYYWTRGLRGQRIWGHLVSGTAACYGYIIGTGAFLYAMRRTAGSALPDSDGLANLFANPTEGLVVAAILGIIFGPIVGWQLSKDDDSPLEADQAERRDSSARRNLALFGAFVVLGIAAAILKGGNPAGQGEGSAAWALGQKALREERYADALPHFEAVVRTSPRNAWGHNALGWTLLRMERTDEAIGHFERAIALAPDASVPHHNLGFALMIEGEFERAEEHYRAALTRDSVRPNLLPQYAWVLARLGRGAEAVQVLERAARADSGQPNVWAELALARSRAGDHPGALADAERALRRDSTNAYLWGFVARLAYNAVDYERARVALARAVKLEPRYFERRPDDTLLQRELHEADSSR